MTTTPHQAPPPGHGAPLLPVLPVLPVLDALPVLDLLPILERASCRTSDPTIFFSDDMAVVARAKEVCAGCPVREQCLARALECREPHGVWGGELFEQGVVIERKRPRGRPRKHPLPLAA